MTDRSPALEHAASELAGLLGELVNASRQAVQALAHGDLEELAREMDVRERILGASEPHLNTLRDAGWAAEHVLERVRLSVESAAREDARLELALSAGMQQVGSQIRHLELEGARTAGYTMKQSSAGGTIDLTR